MTQHQVWRQAAESAIRYRDEVAEARQPPRGFKEILEQFREALPEAESEPGEVIDFLVRHAEPGLRAMTGPRFFGWVIGGSHPVGVAADWLTGAWGQNAGNHHATPSAAAVEAVAAAWLLDLFDLPRESSVGFATGATAANFVCLAAARGEVLRRAGWDVEAHGLFGAPPITVLVGDDAHTTVFSALQFLGLGHDRVVRIKADRNGCMDADDFRRAASAASGPLIAIAQAGQVNTGGFDPFREIIPTAHEAGGWVHVDSAFGLWARCSPSLKHLAEGIEQADSWATDGHKWLQTPYDCGYAIVRDEAAHRRAMTIAASYLPPTAEGERDPTHYVLELSRRARGFATWAMIKHLGRSGVVEMVERHCRVARAMAERLAADPSIEILNDVKLNQVLVRFGATEPPERGDQLTKDTVARIQSDGRCFAGGAVWRGRQVMRISVCSSGTDLQQGVASADAMLDAWRAARAAVV